MREMTCSSNGVKDTPETGAEVAAASEDEEEEDDDDEREAALPPRPLVGVPLPLPFPAPAPAPAPAPSSSIDVPSADCCAAGTKTTLRVPGADAVLAVNDDCGALRAADADVAAWRRCAKDEEDEEPASIA